MSTTPRFSHPELQGIPTHLDVSSTSGEELAFGSRGHKDDNVKITKSSSDKNSITHGFNVEQDKENK